MSRSSVLLTAVLATAAMAVASCGQTDGLITASTTGPLTVNAKADRHADPGGKRPGAKHGGIGLPGLSLHDQDLALSDEQKAQIQAIMAKYRPAPPADTALRDANEALRTALTAETIDAAAVQAAVEARQAAIASLQPPSPAAMLGDVRALLTDTQIATIVDKLQSAPAAPKRPLKPARDGDDRRSDMGAKWNLTTEQQAAMAALMTKLQTDFQAHEPVDHRQAMISFWQTGGTGALALMPLQPPTLPVAELVHASQLLDVSQRHLILGRLGLGGPGGMGHGPGRPGGLGHGGPGQPPFWG